MEKNVLFAGKEYPDGRDFATVATNHNRKVVITVKDSRMESFLMESIPPCGVGIRP